MQTLTAGSPASRAPIWLRGSAIVGILWNAYGVYQFANSFTEAGRAAMIAGMTPAQSQAYLSLPGWVGVVFSVGACCGLLGTIALALNRRVALPVLVTSFIGYGLLFAGDTVHGVFDGAPGQLIILSFVVLIATAMLWVSWVAGRRGLLR
jgi:hypothetical protein